MTRLNSDNLSVNSFVKNEIKKLLNIRLTNSNVNNNNLNFDDNYCTSPLNLKDNNNNYFKENAYSELDSIFEDENITNENIVRINSDYFLENSNLNLNYISNYSKVPSKPIKVQSSRNLCNFEIKNNIFKNSFKNNYYVVELYLINKLNRKEEFLVERWTFKVIYNHLNK